MSKKKKRASYSDGDNVEQDERFAFIAGYTSGGFPYGITWEEQEIIDQREFTDASQYLQKKPMAKNRSDNSKERLSNPSFDLDDIPDLPF